MATASPPPDEQTVTLFRPVGPEELELVRASGLAASLSIEYSSGTGLHEPT
jgi:hypothetical protein